MKPMEMPADLTTSLEQGGFYILRGFLDSAELRLLQDSCQPIAEEYGLRQVLQRYPAIANALPRQKLAAVLQASGMPEAQSVRSVFFNKNAARNWLVGWHQDTTICVSEKTTMAGYSKWTYKQGVHHVEPPASVLENMLTLRIALDDSNADNAALKVIHGSHRLGKLHSTEIEQQVATGISSLCDMSAGDLLLMKPLLLHASDKAIQASRRRVLHIEYSSLHLPAPMQWAEAFQ